MEEKNKEIDNMDIKKRILAALEGSDEIIEKKNVVYDKNRRQFSIKIPKALALRAGIKPESTFLLVLNPKDEQTKNQIKESEFLIILKKDGE